MRTLLFALAVFAFAVPVLGQQPGEPIRVRLHPAAPPSPSLKYRLRPAPVELLPGNAASGYYRALAGLFENPAVTQEIRKDYWGEWQSKPLADFPLDEARKKLAMCGSLLREIDLAARRRECDWGLDGRPEGMGLLLPEAQAYRHVAAVLAVKARVEVAAKDFGGAARTLQTGLALGRHLGTAPNYIHIFIGIAITGMMQRQLDEMIQQPGAPNLYWALTELPRPSFTLDRALREETATIERTLAWLGRLEGGPWTQEQVKAAEAQSRKMLDEFGVLRPEGDEDNHRALIEGAYEGARKALREKGLTAAQVDAMPKLQAVALHTVREFRLASEEVAKWDHVPGGWRHPAFAKDSDHYRDAAARLDVLFFRGLLRGLMEGLTPAAPKVASAIDRVDRRFAAQRCLEALRAHAGAHDGKLPTTLGEITDLPVPTDPLLRRPFDYKVTGDYTATLSAAAPAGEADNKGLTLTYKVTIAARK